MASALNDIGPIVASLQPPPGPSFKILDLLIKFKSSPFLPSVALIGIVCRCNRWLAIVTLITFIYILTTKALGGRVYYLLPYLVGLSSGAFQILRIHHQRTIYRWMYHVGLSILVAWAVGLSLIARPTISFSQKEGRNPEVLISTGRESIGRGPQRVYLGAYEFYYAGRSLGWHMFKSYFTSDQTDLPALLPNVDYAIFRATDINDALVGTLLKAGFHFEKILVDDHKNDLNVSQLKSWRGDPYGPYVLYSR